MSFKSIVRGLRDMKDAAANRSMRGAVGKQGSNRTQSHVFPISDTFIEGKWANLPPTLLTDIIHRVDESAVSWPARSAVVSCASVCKSWRETTKKIVKTPEECGRLTFPVSLKQPGPPESPIQCYVERDKANSVFRLYLGRIPSEDNKDKLLLVAKRINRASGVAYVISFGSDDFSQASNAYVGKLRSNFLGTKYTIHDGHHPSVTVSYEEGNRKPRRMHCTMHSVCSLQSFTPVSKATQSDIDTDISSFGSLGSSTVVATPQEPLVLKNKYPNFSKRLECWNLNFKGRVTHSSVKNFQLLAPGDASQEKIVLQFGKLGRNIFTMDYCYPLTAFQAFAICLTTFYWVRF